MALVFHAHREKAWLKLRMERSENLPTDLDAKVEIRNGLSLGCKSNFGERKKFQIIVERVTIILNEQKSFKITKISRNKFKKMVYVRQIGVEGFGCSFYTELWWTCKREWESDVIVWFVKKISCWELYLTGRDETDGQQQQQWQKTRQENRTEQNRIEQTL